MRNKHLLSIAALLSGSACAGLLAQKPNILFIVAEDASLDFGCYGNSLVSTPNIDKLASQGARFNNAYTTYSVCSPSRGSILTGLYPHQNGQIGLATHKYRMFPGVKTLPVYMRELGYRTGCLGKIHVNPEGEISFDYWKIRSFNFQKRNLPNYAVRAGEFINESDQPFLLMVNLPDSHSPFQRQVEGMPSTLVEVEQVKESLASVGINSDRIREHTTNYYNCINRLDECVGMLLDVLKKSRKYDNTIIIFISDHGAQFSRMKQTNYEGGLRIPAIIKWASLIPAGDVRNELVSVIDLLPTFIDIAGGGKASELPGESLLNLWGKGASVKWRRYLFAGGMGCYPEVHYPCRSVRDQRYKLILNVNHGKENPCMMLYDNGARHYYTGTKLDELKNAPKIVKDSYNT